MAGTYGVGGCCMVFEARKDNKACLVCIVCWFHMSVITPPCECDLNNVRMDTIAFLQIRNFRVLQAANSVRILRSYPERLIRQVSN